MAAIVRAVSAYKEACFAAERPTHIEEVIVCDPSSANVTKTKRSVERLARAGYADPAAPAAATPKPKKAPGEGPARKRGAPKLRPDDIASARAKSGGALMTARVLRNEGEFFIHPTFGVGQVQVVKPERMVVVLFEDGLERTMIHAR